MCLKKWWFFFFSPNGKWTSKNWMIFSVRISLNRSLSLFWMSLMKSLHKHVITFQVDREEVKEIEKKRSELESVFASEFYPCNDRNLNLGLNLTKCGGIQNPCSILDFAACDQMLYTERKYYFFFNIVVDVLIIVCNSAGLDMEHT